VNISIVIPAFNEELSIAKVLGDIPEFVHEIIVVDNGSTDNTRIRAEEGGGRVVEEKKRGYGKACQTGIASVNSSDIVVILDADYSDYPHDLPLLTDPIINGKADFVIGSRILGKREKGAMAPQVYWGNWLATFLINLLFGKKFTDLGPFRAIRYDKLIKLKMEDENFGWNVEMQIKALKNNLRILEVPVRYRKRIGKSKISGTLSGTFRAGFKIIYSILKYRFF